MTTAADTSRGPRATARYGAPPDAPEPGPRPLTTAALDLLDRSERELLAAFRAEDPAERYVHAHLAALRAGAAVLAVHPGPVPAAPARRTGTAAGRAAAAPRRRRGGPRSVWEVLPQLAPELTVWAAEFTASAGRRAAVEAGRTGVVDAAAADALLAAAEAFHHAVEDVLGLSRTHPLAG
ncbi:SAV_6107 family HEPN domain-containing protein [Kineococcus terrestris]|uniref:SAV_6107 family HEPN domain-containing protein n=1 Tax=Kineococcus terrestris TaxID=2044856 RepID=UPI0034DB104B